MTRCVCVCVKESLFANLCCFVQITCNIVRHDVSLSPKLVCSWISWLRHGTACQGRRTAHPPCSWCSGVTNILRPTVPTAVILPFFTLWASLLSFCSPFIHSFTLSLSLCIYISIICICVYVNLSLSPCFPLLKYNGNADFLQKSCLTLFPFGIVIS